MPQCLSRKATAVALILTCILLSCNGPGSKLFGSKHPHERYTEKLTSAGLQTTALGKSWLGAAEKGLIQPLTIQLPYREIGYFDAGTPDAAGFRFNARRGDKLMIELTQKPAGNAVLFMDLWQPGNTGKPELLIAPDSALAGLQYEVKKDGVYILRLQPELLAGVEYAITIRTGPSLAFPVSTSANPRVASFWGDVRDAGARKHEGIDIFGPKRTPLVAAADGTITSVSENRLGGKVVFLRPNEKDYVLYYAHLDSQMVSQGQRVRIGDTIGLMGNTGNAVTTPPHLHFGIYAAGGAIDPLPFVKRDRIGPPVIKVTIINLNELLRVEKRTDLFSAIEKAPTKITFLDATTLVRISGATDHWYKVKLPNNIEGFVEGADLRPASELRRITVQQQLAVFDKPDSTAARKAFINKGALLPVLGTFNNYYYVKNDTLTGWVSM